MNLLAKVVSASSFSREVSVLASGQERQPAWVHLPEVGDDRIVWHIRVVTSLPDVLHMPAASLVVFVEKRVVSPIELQREDTESFAKAQVEGRRSFHPPTLKMKLGEAVPDEEVAANQLDELLRGEVVAHVGIADPRGDAHGLGRCC